MRKLAFAPAALIALSMLTSCGGDGGSEDAPAPTAVPSPAPTPTPTTTALSATTGCRSRSSLYPWGQAEVRTWTPNGSTETGAARGAPFQARLVQAWGTDSDHSRRSAIFELADGCRRQFVIRSLAAADVAVVDAAIAAHPITPDPRTYVTRADAEGQVTDAQIANGQVGVYATQHFAFLFGTRTGNFSYNYVRGQGIEWQTFLRRAGETLERAWLLDRDLMNAPMPFAGDAAPRRVNVYICGTGLPFIANGDDGDCGASAAPALYVSSVYLADGSTTAGHEFAHVIQFYSGGFRDKSGPIWETGANWSSFTQSPTLENGVGFYFANVEKGPLWSTSRYGAFPFMTYLFEKDDTRRFLWTTWTGNLRAANGASTEDWVETLVRLAGTAGVYPNGFRSFADDMGWYGARLAAMDFLARQTLSGFVGDDPAAPLRAGLTPSATANGYASPSARPLLQFGSHIVPLTPTTGTVRVALTGATTANAAAWRFTLVSVAPDGTPRYAPLATVEGTGTAETTITPVAGERLYLAVTATPYTYESLGWQPDGPVRGTTFPYTVTITGASPRTTG